MKLPKRIHPVSPRSSSSQNLSVLQCEEENASLRQTSKQHEAQIEDLQKQVLGEFITLCS